MKNLKKALKLAENVHYNQMYGKQPYMYHIKQVVDIAIKHGFCENIVIACALHDTLEDTNLLYNDIVREFNQEVAEIVYCVTDELGRNRKERKENTYPKIKSNWKAIIVKLCDRIANINHSKENNNKIYKMYQKEHKDFCVGIADFKTYNKTHVMWGELFGCFNNL